MLGIEGLTGGRFTAVAHSPTSTSRQKPARRQRSTELAGRTIMNLFFEDITRTRTSFEWPESAWVAATC